MTTLFLRINPANKFSKKGWRFLIPKKIKFSFPDMPFLMNRHFLLPKIYQLCMILLLLQTLATSMSDFGELLVGHEESSSPFGQNSPLTARGSPTATHSNECSVGPTHSQPQSHVSAPTTNSSATSGLPSGPPILKNSRLSDAPSGSDSPGPPHLPSLSRHILHPHFGFR